jgi:monovalent cation:H+ antiporter-2, CPA2 family
MPETHAFLQNLALVLCVAAVTSLVCQRLKQPVVFGYLLAGLIIGPHIPIPLVADEAMVHTLAELGVILLMFALGLEFSLRKLLQVGPTAGVIAVIQTSTMVFIGYVLGRAFGWTSLESVYTGAVIAISSTTIIVKAFAEQKLTGRFTSIVFGVLIIEDLIGILLLAILTTVSAGEGVSAGALAMTALRLVVFLAGLVAVGLVVVPRLVRATVRLDRPETTLVVTVGICFAAALLALTFGYSVALGAFIGGSLVAESGRAKTIEHLVAPVRDMFGAIFFVAVGMLIDPALVAEHWRAVAILTVAVIVGKLIGVSIGAFLAGYGTRTSVQAGMSLAQIGEFSFIIAGIGLSTGATRPFLYPVAVAVSAITTLTTPWLIRASGPVASLVDRALPQPLQTFAALYQTWLERLRKRPKGGRGTRVRRLLRWVLVDVALLGLLVVAGSLELGRATTFLAAWLSVSPQVARQVVIGGALVLALPLVLGFFRAARGLGAALAEEVLPLVAAGKVDMGAAPRRALAVVMQLAVVFVLGVPLLAITEPFLPPLRGPALFALVLSVLAVSVWRSITNLQGHTRAGAEMIVGALSRQMAALDDPHGAGTGPAEPMPLPEISQLLPGMGEPVGLRLLAADWAAGRKLAELDVRSRTGAVILAITREGAQIPLPTGHDALLAGDVLAVAGTRAAVRAAAILLRTGTVGVEGEPR